MLKWTMYLMPKRMRRVVLLSTLMAVLCQSPKELTQLAKEVNSERHIADDESAFKFGFTFCELFWKSVLSQVQSVGRADWLNRVISMAQPLARYDKEVLEEDLRSIRNHIHA